MPTFSRMTKKIPAVLKTKWAIGAAVLVLFGGGYWFLTAGKTSYQFVTVTKGAITETVSVTGNSTPVKSVSLGFGNSGTVSWVNAAVGDRVAAGTVLASLNTGDLSAQLKQAQANVETQQAKLSGLEAGSRPEDIAAAQAAYDKAVQDLANLYSGVSDTSNDAYAKANDAVRTQLSVFFSNGETTHPQLTFGTAGSQAKSDAESGRALVGTTLNDWQTALFSLTPSSAPADIDAAILSNASRLTIVRTFLGNVSTVVNNANNLDAATTAAYKADIAAAMTEVNTAVKNINTAAQAIASQKLAVAQLKAQLDLKKAGSSVEDIAAQAAQVSQAEASVESAQAKLVNSSIVAPISGIVTQFDAKVGQVASPGTPLVAIISDSAFEIDAYVAETDIGKVVVGDSVGLQFDAFPNETFAGTVFYVDPAQTISQGAVNYLVKVSFTKPDPRMKSGLTANLDIATKHKDSALILPQYAILQNDVGTFVETVENGKTVQHPVTLGLSDNKGNVEVVSGVSEGEQVLNIGLKQ